MAKSMIIYGVPGGKTRFAQRIADHFGLKLATVYDGASPWYPDGWLYFLPRIDAHESTAEYSRSFQSVADEINAAIPRTEWFEPSILPVNCGVYEVDDMPPEQSERYGFQEWNGEHWSGFGLSANEAAHGFGEGFKSSWQSNYWRGLSSEPIKVTE